MSTCSTSMARLLSKGDQDVRTRLLRRRGSSRHPTRSRAPSDEFANYELLDKANLVGHAKPESAPPHLTTVQAIRAASRSCPRLTKLKR